MCTIPEGASGGLADEPMFDTSQRNLIDDLPYIDTHEEKYMKYAVQLVKKEVKEMTKKDYLVNFPFPVVECISTEDEASILAGTPPKTVLKFDMTSEAKLQSLMDV